MDRRFHGKPQTGKHVQEHPASFLTTEEVMIKPVLANGAVDTDPPMNFNRIIRHPPFVRATRKMKTDF
jgi:hypothetical protein